MPQRESSLQPCATSRSFLLLGGILLGAVFLGAVFLSAVLVGGVFLGGVFLGGVFLGGVFLGGAALQRSDRADCIRRGFSHCGRPFLLRQLPHIRHERRIMRPLHLKILA